MQHDRNEAFALRIESSLRAARRATRNLAFVCSALFALAFALATCQYGRLQVALLIPADAILAICVYGSVWWVTTRCFRSTHVRAREVLRSLRNMDGRQRSPATQALQAKTTVGGPIGAPGQVPKYLSLLRLAVLPAAGIAVLMPVLARPLRTWNWVALIILGLVVYGYAIASIWNDVRVMRGQGLLGAGPIQLKVDDDGE